MNCSAQVFCAWWWLLASENIYRSWGLPLIPGNRCSCTRSLNHAGFTQHCGPRRCPGRRGCLPWPPSLWQLPTCEFWDSTHQRRPSMSRTSQTLPGLKRLHFSFACLQKTFWWALGGKNKITGPALEPHTQICKRLKTLIHLWTIWWQILMQAELLRAYFSFLI